MQGFSRRPVAVCMAMATLFFTIPALAKEEKKRILSPRDVVCTVPKAPMIKIEPKAAAVRYDYSKTTAELTRQGSQTVNPYAANVDSTTGGLRADTPKIRSDVKTSIMTYPALGVGCLWYEEVSVVIELSPVIYIAKEFQKDPACKAAIMEHELKHVSVDRDVINNYATQIGKAIQTAVNRAGALGPFKVAELDAQQDNLMDHIQSAISSQQVILDKDMRSRQARVDSLEEYERVSAICKDVVRKLK
ncbi:MAG: hypothetical protein ACK4NR_04940 [Micavibrio sp.]